MRWIEATDEQRAKAWKKEANSINFELEFEILKENADKIKKSSASPKRKEVRLEELRKDWNFLLRRKKFAETGINEN